MRPTLLRDTPVSRLWYKKDDRFWLPKANVDIMLYSYVHCLIGWIQLIFSPLLDVTPRNAVLARLLCEMFEDATTEDVYDASLAELSFGLYYSGDTLSISAGGFSDKLAVLTETMLNKLMAFDIDESRFEKITDSVSLEHWYTMELTSPDQTALDQLWLERTVYPRQLLGIVPDRTDNVDTGGETQGD
jgi:insulysin